nr:hypothetical protein [uncultured Lacibacter sp.]
MRTFLLFSILMMAIACSKESANPELAGTWRLLEVKDKSTGQTLTYPAGSNGFILLHIKADGSFSGNTLKNTLDSGTYTLPETGKVNFGTFAMTKVAENELGTAFLTVLMSCNLQSLFPCTPSGYSISGKRLEIRSALRYDMTLVRN